MNFSFNDLLMSTSALQSVVKSQNFNLGTCVFYEKKNIKNESENLQNLRKC